jgi:hypothetical protein
MGGGGDEGGTGFSADFDHVRVWRLRP